MPEPTLRCCPNCFVVFDQLTGIRESVSSLYGVPRYVFFCSKECHKRWSDEEYWRHRASAETVEKVKFEET